MAAKTRSAGKRKHREDKRAAALRENLKKRKAKEKAPDEKDQDQKDQKEQ